MGADHASDSAVQRRVEEHIFRLVSEELHFELEHRVWTEARTTLPDGARIDVDGYWLFTIQGVPLIGLVAVARQHRTTQLERRCPTTSRPSSSRRANEVRSGPAKVASGISRSPRWAAAELSSSGDLAPYAVTDAPTPRHPQL